MKIVVIGGSGLIGSSSRSRTGDPSRRPTAQLDALRLLRRAKIAQEKLIKSGTIPYSIVHATQFFEFLKQLADISFDGKTVRLPDALFQPMAADDVATAVGRVAVGQPINGTVEIGGPEVFRIDELVRRRLAALHDSREVIADPNARYSGAKIEERALVPGKDARLGETSFETWLTQSVVKAAATAH
jgi:uncharacterized protein YbjT (DUF2867 family)